jgi:hypothetical protein
MTSYRSGVAVILNILSLEKILHSRPKNIAGPISDKSALGGSERRWAQFSDVGGDR